MKKLFVSVVGTRDWQCRHIVFDTIFDFEDYCLTYAPHKQKQIKEYGTLQELCTIVSDAFVTFQYEWQK